MSEEYCGGCDRRREVNDADVAHLPGGDIQFRCRDCRTLNTNRMPIIRAEAA